MAPGLPCPAPSTFPPSVDAARTPPATHLVATPAPSVPTPPLGQPLLAVSSLPSPIVFSLPLISLLPLLLATMPPLACAPLYPIPPMPSSSLPPAGVARRVIVVV